MAFNLNDPGRTRQGHRYATASEAGLQTPVARSARRRLFAVAILALGCHATVHAAQVSWGSDGSDGVLAPLNSLEISPGPDGTFNFTSVDIPRDVLVSVERDSSTSDVRLLATGDITIRGALDTGVGTLHLHTPGTVSIEGKLYGDSIHIGYGQLHLVDNPNGNPDVHRNNAGSVTINPDGPLPVEPGTNIGTVNAVTLSGSVSTMMSIAVEPGVISLAPPSVDNFQLAQPGGSITLQAPQVTLIANTPIPAALPLLASALLGLAGLGLRNARNNTLARKPVSDELGT